MRKCNIDEQMLEHIDGKLGHSCDIDGNPWWFLEIGVTPNHPFSLFVMEVSIRYPQNVWVIMENPKQKWMMTRDNPHDLYNNHNFLWFPGWFS